MDPLTHRSYGSLVSIMTWAPILKLNIRAVGGSKSVTSPVVVASIASSSPGRRSRQRLFRSAAIRLVVVSVSQNSPSGGSKSGSVRALSRSRAWPTSEPSRMELRMLVRAGSSDWRNTWLRSTVGKCLRLKCLAEKKYGVS